MPDSRAEMSLREAIEGRRDEVFLGVTGVLEWRHDRINDQFLGRGGVVDGVLEGLLGGGGGIPGPGRFEVGLDLLEGRADVFEGACGCLVGLDLRGDRVRCHARGDLFGPGDAAVGLYGLRVERAHFAPSATTRTRQPTQGIEECWRDASGRGGVVAVPKVR